MDSGSCSPWSNDEFDDVFQIRSYMITLKVYVRVMRKGACRAGIVFYMEIYMDYGPGKWK